MAGLRGRHRFVAWTGASAPC